MAAWRLLDAYRQRSSPAQADAGHDIQLAIDQGIQYVAERDEYVCPAGQRLHLFSQSVDKGQEVRYYTNGAACRDVVGARLQPAVCEHAEHVRTSSSTRAYGCADRCR